MTVAPLDFDLAVATARSREPTRGIGASLGDRVCRALAQQRQMPLVTGDRRFATIDPDPDPDFHVALDIRLIR